MTAIADVSRETGPQFELFVSLLQRWNERINLIGPISPNGIWSRHIADSLQLVPLLPDRAEPIVDLGSGAGLPGLVLAIATGIEIHLVEADRRKSAFLSEAVRALGLSHVTVHADRIERCRTPKAAVVTARALAHLTALLGYAHRLLRPDGVAIFPKGRGAEEELTAAARAWRMTIERFPSRTDPAATIFRIRDIRPAHAPA